MKSAAHHLDLRGSDPSDPSDVTSTREQEANIINGWLSDIVSEEDRINKRKTFLNNL